MNEEAFEEEVHGFLPGDDVIITDPQGKTMIGTYAGFTDFGMFIKMLTKTDRMKETFSPDFRNEFVARLVLKTIAELRELAEEEEIPLTGLKRKDEIVAEISDVMLARAEEHLEPIETLVDLKRPILTLVPWQTIDLVQSAQEFLEELNLADFGAAVAQHPGVVENDPSLAPRGVGDSGE